MRSDCSHPFTGDNTIGGAEIDKRIRIDTDSGRRAPESHANGKIEPKISNMSAGFFREMIVIAVPSIVSCQERFLIRRQLFPLVVAVK